MSYCRFSTNDFLCDLYCYESDHGFITYVASSRPVYKEPLPAPLELTSDTVNDYAARWQKVMEMFEAAGKVEIGLPYDGATFTDGTRAEFLDTLVMLKNAGYKFPDGVIRAVVQEMAEDEAE